MKSRICSLAGILLMAAVILVFLPLTVPRLFGYQIYGILTDSMEPNYPAGCVVYVKETDSAGSGWEMSSPFRWGRIRIL
mgnify:CR=1 FL=1